MLKKSIIAIVMLSGFEVLNSMQTPRRSPQSSSELSTPPRQIGTSTTITSLDKKRKKQRERMAHVVTARRRKKGGHRFKVHSSSALYLKRLCRRYGI